MKVLVIQSCYSKIIIVMFSNNYYCCLHFDFTVHVWRIETLVESQRDHDRVNYRLTEQVASYPGSFILE